MKHDPIKIDRVAIYEIDLPLRVPFQISGGVMRSRRSIVVQLHSGDHIGYGESAPFQFPFYASETIGSVLALYRDLLVERVQGQTFESIETFDATLRAGVRGNAFARCGFENAFWDLIACKTGHSLTDLIADKLADLGAPDHERTPADHIDSGVAIGIPESEDLGEFRDWVTEYQAEGYRRVKLKIRPGWDAEPCRVAREVLGDDFPLWPDANAAYQLPEHEKTLAALDEFNLTFIEQPLHHDDLLDHARLAQSINTPICLDESLKDARVARQAIELKASRIWNIKLQRMGGLLEALRVYAVAAEHNVALWGGTMPESGIGAQPILALAAFPRFKYPADVEPSNRWYEPHTDPLEITMTPTGQIAVPKVAGTTNLLNHDLFKATRTSINC